jgi:hypothetical protein
MTKSSIAVVTGEVPTVLVPAGDYNFLAIANRSADKVVYLDYVGGPDAVTTATGIPLKAGEVVLIANERMGTCRLPFGVKCIHAEGASVNVAVQANTYLP